MSLHVRSSRIAAEWETWEAVLEPSGEEEQKGVHKVTFGYRQLLPWQAKLLVTDWVVGVVLFQGGDTCLALSGGQRGCERQARRLELQKRHEAGVKESAKQKQFANEAARPPVDPEDFEVCCWHACMLACLHVRVRLVLVLAVYATCTWCSEPFGGMAGTRC